MRNPAVRVRCGHSAWSTAVVMLGARDRRLAHLEAHLVGIARSAKAPQKEEIGLGFGGEEVDAAALAGVEREHHMVPMRDGTRISAYVFTPSGSGTFPALLQQVYVDISGAAARCAEMAAKGYIVAVSNYRGCHLSEGRYTGYRALALGEHHDAYDTVEWLAAHPRCTGKVGTFGGSQGGIAQNFTAVDRPPSLVCSHMSNTALSLFEEGYRLGGLTRFGRFESAMTSHCRDPSDNAKLLQEWQRHPDKDSWWDQEDTSLHFDKMDVPCFIQGSWYDYMNLGTIGSYLGRQHQGGPNSRGAQRLLIGPVSTVPFIMGCTAILQFPPRG